MAATAAERAQRDVTARGVRMRVIEAGAPSAPTILLVHGFLASHLDFDDVIDALAKHYYVIAPDLPGFGESEKPTPTRYRYGVEIFAEAMADLIAAYGVGRARVVGHGLGGAVALTLATQCAELVSHLVLVDPLCFPCPVNPKLRVPLWPVVGGTIFKQWFGRRGFRRYFRDEVLSGSTGVPLSRIDRFYDLFNSPLARESAHAVLRATRDTRPVVARLSRLRCPCLIVWGREDRIYPASFAFRLNREIAGARLRVFETGHAPHVEAPEQFVASLRDFFEEPS